MEITSAFSSRGRKIIFVTKFKFNFLRCIENTGVTHWRCLVAKCPARIHTEGNLNS